MYFGLRNIVAEAGWLCVIAAFPFALGGFFKYNGMNPEQFLSIMFPVPPIREQERMTAYLNSKCGKIDALISLKQSKIEKLTRYRQSLIYEYVTGKKEAP